jgi:DtxR family transcriptional regulator, Mn-dependent transcriptional regulator
MACMVGSKSPYHAANLSSTQLPAFMPSLTVENYVKAIYQISSQRGGEPAATGQLAAALGVSPGTVTSMLKTLGESNLAEYTPHHGATLTPSGHALALRVVRRHRLIELFLVRTLDLTWDEVHDEAEHMEHAVSDLLVDRIDAYLGYPNSDPHGDPIPRADGSLPTATTLVRVMDQSPEFLRYLSGAEMQPGTLGRVVANRSEAGSLTVEVAGQVTSLGRDMAEKLLVAQP